MSVKCDEREGKVYLPETNIELLPQLASLVLDMTEVIPDPANPRKAVYLDELKDGIRVYGVRWPIVVNKRTKMIEAGHQRYYSLKEMGAKHIPVLWADDDPIKATGFNISDNRLGEIVSEWDEAALGKMLKALADEDHLKGTGFDADEVAALLSKLADAEEGGEDPPDPEDMDKVPAITEDGDIWTLARHRLICGDSTKKDVVARLMNGEKARMIFTDPPYNVNYGVTMKDVTRSSKAGSKAGRKIKNDFMEKEQFAQFLTDALSAMMEHCDGSMYVCMSGQELDTLQDSFRKAGGYWSTFIIWVKQAFTIGMSNYQRQYEPILYGWPEGAKNKHWCGDRDQSDVWEHSRPVRNDLHPCLSPDSMIVTKNGYQPISDVGVGDFVLGHDGLFHAVEDVTHHDYSEDIYRLMVSGSSLAVEATHDHPFMIRRRVGNGEYDKPRFVEASELLIGDYVLTPVLKCGEGGPTEDEAWAIGLFSAEGSFIKAGHGEKQFPRYSLHRKEVDFIRRIESAFGSKASVYDNHANSINVVFFNSDWGKKLEEMCGRGAANKRLPDFSGWGADARKALLDGYLDGDGSSIRHYSTCKTVSPYLASQVIMLAESLGFKTNVNVYNAPDGAGIGDRIFKTTLPFYMIFISPQRSRCAAHKFFEYEGVNYFTRRITDISKDKYNDIVCNLVVKGCHTFQTAIGMSHNTMKPIDLVERAIKNSSERDNLVLDTFMGSGTTLIAAERIERRCNGAELDARYCDVICQRFHKMTGVSPIREKDNAQWVDLALAQDAEVGKPAKRKVKDK